jgi:methylthioribulose-1-phosphate dehydratase
MHPYFPQAAQLVIEMGSFASEKGWAAATGGNFSTRLDSQRIAITATGTHKGKLTLLDVLEAHLEQPYPARSSAESAIHFNLYRASPDIGAVFHIHSPYAILMSMACTSQDHVCLEGYELLKALDGIKTHEMTLNIPLLPNTQDMESVGRKIPALMAQSPLSPAFLLTGHGLTAWGRTPNEAMRHGETLEFLLQLEWMKRDRL